jgi:hypothetical protein
VIPALRDRRIMSFMSLRPAWITYQDPVSKRENERERKRREREREGKEKGDSLQLEEEIDPFIQLLVIFIHLIRVGERGQAIRDGNIPYIVDKTHSSG